MSIHAKKALAVAGAGGDPWQVRRIRHGNGDTSTYRFLMRSNTNMPHDAGDIEYVLKTYFDYTTSPDRVVNGYNMFIDFYNKETLAYVKSIKVACGTLSDGYELAMFEPCHVTSTHIVFQVYQSHPTNNPRNAGYVVVNHTTGVMNEQRYMVDDSALKAELLGMLPVSGTEYLSIYSWLNSLYMTRINVSTHSVGTSKAIAIQTSEDNIRPGSTYDYLFIPYTSIKNSQVQTRVIEFGRNAVVKQNSGQTTNTYNTTKSLYTNFVAINTRECLMVQVHCEDASSSQTIGFVKYNFGTNALTQLKSFTFGGGHSIYSDSNTIYISKERSAVCEVTNWWCTPVNIYDGTEQHGALALFNYSTNTLKMIKFDIAPDGLLRVAKAADGKFSVTIDEEDHSSNGTTMHLAIIDVETSPTGAVYYTNAQGDRQAIVVPMTPNASYGLPTLTFGSWSVTFDTPTSTINSRSFSGLSASIQSPRDSYADGTITNM